MVDGDGSMIMAFLYQYYYGSTQANRGIRGEKLAGVGSDGTIMISLCLIFIHVLTSFDGGRTKFRIISYLSYSPALF